MNKSIYIAARDEGWAGRYIRNYRPRVTAHSLVHAFIPKRRILVPSAVIVQQKKFPDVSFWQGKIDWDMMRELTDTVIIRAGQNEWEDSEFRTNYAEAGKRGMLRGIYWFYDDRKDPGRQADKCISLVAADPPELKVYTDWENKYGGAFGGLKNVVAFMQRVETLPPLESALYTGYYFFTENSNPITNAPQYKYLKEKELWLAWYTDNFAEVLVPASLTLTHLQYGTPPRGAEFGCQSREIDMNITALTDGEFYNRYGSGKPLPKGRITINIRSKP